MKSNWILLGLLYFITCACQKKEADLLSPVKQTGDLEITVLYQQQPVENTEVTLFYTQTDLQRNQNPYRLPQLTDINGKLLWNELEAGRTYFFYAKKDTVMASGSVLNGNAVQPNIVNRFTAVLGPRPACELNNWGAIYVVNSSNRKFRIWMDGNFLREINPNS
ncbi:MAG: hypothetical protein NZ108_08680, partial [Bacteroidia bacterium]|nr:hypothetical protein [Bacteroidia bacterium]